jgi:hypothetical protein
LKVAYEYDNKTFVLELFIILRSSFRKWTVKIKDYEKKFYRVKILGWSKNHHGTFSGSKLLDDFKNVHVLCVFFYFFFFIFFELRASKIKYRQISRNLIYLNTSNSRAFNQNVIQKVEQIQTSIEN